MTRQIQNLFSPSPVSVVLRPIRRLFSHARQDRARRILFLAALISLGAVRPGSAQEADLVVLDFTFSPQSINAGAHPTSVSYSYGNAGPDDIDADSVVEEVFLSRNRTLGDADDIRIWHNERFFGLLG